MNSGYMTNTTDETKEKKIYSNHYVFFNDL